MKIGDVVEQKYELVRLLGQGGMGTVFEGRHLQLDRRVALKFLRAELAQDEAMARRFLNEARAAASIGSENIVEVVDVGKTPEGEPFMVMEFVDGRELASLLTEQGPFAPARAAQIVIQLCHALASAHAKGIIHRDIKPENMIVEQRIDGSERVKVLDFGLVKFRQSVEGQTANLTATGATMGTPYYMAPEQALGLKDLDHRVDIYSSGVVLFQVLTGALPFDGETYAEILVKAATKEPLPPRQVRPDLSPELEAIMLRAIARERDQRFQTAPELAQALAPFTQNAAVASTIAAMPVPAATMVAPSNPNQSVPGQMVQGSYPSAPGFAPPPSHPHLPPQTLPAGSPISPAYGVSPVGPGSNPYQSAPGQAAMGVAPGSNPYQSAPQMMGVPPGSNPYQSAPQLQATGPRRSPAVWVAVALAVVLLAGLASAAVWYALQGDEATTTVAGPPPPAPETPGQPPLVAAVQPTATAAVDPGAGLPAQLASAPTGDASPAPTTPVAPGPVDPGPVDPGAGADVSPREQPSRRDDRRHTDPTPSPTPTREPDPPPSREPDNRFRNDFPTEPSPIPAPVQPQPMVQPQPQRPPPPPPQPVIQPPPPQLMPPTKRPANVALAEGISRARAGDWGGCLRALSDSEPSGQVTELRLRCYRESGNIAGGCAYATRCGARVCRRFAQRYCR